MTALMQRNVIVNGRRTSMKLEGTVWGYLEEIAQSKGKKVSTLISEIENSLTDQSDNLSAEVRMYILNHYKKIADSNDAWVSHEQLRREHEETVYALLKEISELQDQVKHHLKLKNDRHSILARDIMDVLIRHSKSSVGRK